MTDTRPYYDGLELTRLQDWARCAWPLCRIVTGLGIGHLVEPHCNEHAQWVTAQTVEDSLYAARGCVHQKHLVCDRCVRLHLLNLETIEADCGCVYSVAEESTTHWCEEHGGPAPGIAEAVASS